MSQPLTDRVTCACWCAVAHAQFSAIGLGASLAANPTAAATWNQMGGVALSATFYVVAVAVPLAVAFAEVLKAVVCIAAAASSWPPPPALRRRSFMRSEPQNHAVAHQAAALYGTDDACHDGGGGDDDDGALDEQHQTWRLAAQGVQVQRATPWQRVLSVAAPVLRPWACLDVLALAVLLVMPKYGALVRSLGGNLLSCGAGRPGSPGAPSLLRKLDDAAHSSDDEEGDGENGKASFDVGDVEMASSPISARGELRWGVWAAIASAVLLHALARRPGK